MPHLVRLKNCCGPGIPKTCVKRAFEIKEKKTDEKCDNNCPLDDFRCGLRI